MRYDDIDKGANGVPNRPTRKGASPGLETGVSNCDKFTAGKEHVSGQTGGDQRPTRGKTNIPGRTDPESGRFCFKG